MPLLPALLPKGEGSKTLCDYLKLQNSPRYDHRRSTHANLLNFTFLAPDLEADPAGTINEIALLDHEFVNTIDWIDTGRTMMDQITAQRPRGAAGGRIFTNVLSNKEARMRARFANFDRLASECVATGCATERIAAFVNLAEHWQVYAAVPEIRQ